LHRPHQANFGVCDKLSEGVEARPLPPTVIAAQGPLIHSKRSVDPVQSHGFRQHLDAPRQDKLASPAVVPEQPSTQGSVDAILRGWAMREMAPWLLKGVNSRQAMQRLRYLNANREWSVLFQFVNGEVSIAPKPTATEAFQGYDQRASLYLNFFRAVAQTLPFDFQISLCMTLRDLPPEESEAPVFSFQKKRGAHNPLLPDVDFLMNDFYCDPSFIDSVLYRDKARGAAFSGSTTGGAVSESVARNFALPRLRAARFFQGHKSVDFRLPNIVQVDSPEAKAVLEAMPFCQKPPLDWREQLQRRFILSMDGNGATCSRVVIALMSNSVLLKYDSNDVLYYFDGLQPWAHYVPVTDDRDVDGIINFEARNAERFEQIAAAGRAFALTYLNRDSVFEYTRALLMLYAESMSDRPVASNQEASPLESASSGVAPKVVAHIAGLGDMRSNPDGWAGRRGSGLAVEGFSISMDGDASVAPFTYQAVQANGALSEAARAGQYCGSRGQSAPIFGFRLQMDEDFAAAFEVTYEAQFLDGTRVGALRAPQICRASSQAPLEAFKVTFWPIETDKQSTVADSSPGSTAPSSPGSGLKQDPQMAGALDLMFRPDLPPLLWTPRLLDKPSAWWGHVPFASWVTAVCKPRVLVELGSQHGVSYCAFCEAISRLRLDAKSYAVDTWKGDAQAGFYPDAVYEELAAFNESNYASFSRLIRATFDEAREQFADGSIDLLHIDGYHSYEAVRHDFESWRSKLSERAVVLFHDTAVRMEGFGVWRFFDELSQTTPCFSFLHSEGLGVAVLGAEAPETIKDLCRLDDRHCIEAVRERFSQLGGHWVIANNLHLERGRHLSRIQALEQRLETRESELEQLRARTQEPEVIASP